MPIKEKLIADSTNWVDVTGPSVGEMEELSTRFRLNQHTVLDCLQPEHLPKYEYDEEGEIHFLILRFYEHDVKEKAATIQELTNKIAIFCTDNFLITIHKSDPPFLKILSGKCTVSKPSSTTELLSKIMWQALETYDEPANRLSEQVDFYEHKVLMKKADSDLTEALYYVKRQATLLHKVLMLMLEPINHINVGNSESSLLQDVRDQHLKMQTLYAQIQEESNNLLNLSTAFAGQRTNEVMRILTLFSVFFMPIPFIVGVYGMNFEFMPELRQRWSYPAVLVFMLLVSLVIFAWFKRRK